MNKAIKAKNVDVVLLCGGKGRRLRTVVNEVPKPLAEINRRPFLDILMEYVAGFGFRRFILCTGYKGNLIRRYYERKPKIGLKILFSQEKRPLGTGGAIKEAEALIKSCPFLVMNADSLCRLRPDKFLDFHKKKEANFSIGLSYSSACRRDCGSVVLNSADEVIGFNEKTRTKGNRLLNSGIYLFEEKVFSLIPRQRFFSLEYDLFPAIVHKGFYGFKTRAKLIDIGTPERYAQVIKILKNR